MNLWIRSQDKTILTIIKDLRIDIKDSGLNGRYKIQGNLAEEEYYELGVYKTKERALEVLDEIQKYLIFSKNAEINNVDFLKYLNTECNQQKCNDILNNISVYEMPKE